VALQVAVCGPRECTAADQARAAEVGRLLARAGAVVICGGGPGVMAAVAAGASRENGLVIGVRPDADPGGACAGLSAVIVTNMGQARNAVIVWSADAVISVGGSWGTLSEIALARRRGHIPVISLGGWSVRDSNGQPLPDGPAVASSPEQAVNLALQAAPSYISGHQAHRPQ
jgi:uncharacterized protein (TIGR00725 family)